MSSTARCLVLARSTRRRCDAVLAWLEERPPGSTEALLVGPHRGAADDLARRGRSDRLGLHRATALQVAHELAALPLAREGRTPISGLPVEALAARALEEQRRELEYFAPVAELPGFGRALARTLLEVRAERVGPDELQALGPSGPDLARLLQSYERLLEERGLADPPAVLAIAARTAANGRHHWLELPTALLDPWPRTRSDAAFLRALLARSPHSIVSGPADDSELAERLREVAAAAGAAEGLDVRDLDYPGAAAAADRPHVCRLDLIRARLFQGDGGDGDAEGEGENGHESEADAAGARSGLGVFAAAGESHECAEIARRLRELAARDELPFDRCAVVVRDPDLYLPLLEEALGRARIPFWATRGTVRPDPAGRAFLALLACADERLSASRFAEYLSLGQVPPPPAAPDLPIDDGGGPRSPEAESAPPDTTDTTDDVPWVEASDGQLVFKSAAPKPPPPDADPAPPDRPPPAAAPRRWEQLLVDAAVVGGRDRWERRLRGLENELRRRLARAEDPAPIRRRLERLLELERFALPLVADLDALPTSARWGDWLRDLERLATRALTHPEEVLRVLADLRPMEDVGPIRLAEVRRVLEERLTTLRLEPARRRWGRVFVATPEEMLGRSFDVVFLPGLAEGLFPRRVSEDPLLLDTARRDLAAMRTQEHRVADERRLLRIAVGAAETSLVVSWPRLDPIQGRARVPSLYALEIVRAAEGRLPDLPDLERLAREASPSTLGWPAPRDPALAIDDAEFDLAWLGPLLRPGRRPDGDPTGRGRYLLSVNDALDRSLRRRWLRWHTSRLTVADGLIDDGPAVREVLQGHRLTARSYSPTALQHFAACPYRFLLQAVHRLRPRDEAEALEQMDPLTRGSLFHEAQFRLFQQLEKDGLLPMTLDARDALFDRADRTLDGLAAEWADELAPAIDTIWAQEVEGLRADLRGWIQTVIERDGDWTPIHFELAFGLRERDGRDRASRRDPAVVLDGVRLRGSIDLVERGAGGLLRVTDHKTGSYRGRRGLVVGGGEILQPLLYALAAEEVLESEVEGGRLFFCTRKGDYKTVEVSAGTAERKTVERVLGEVDHSLETGFFPALPRQRGSAPAACRYCDYVAVCGPAEPRRTERKRDDPRRVRLESLRSLS